MSDDKVIEIESGECGLTLLLLSSAALTLTLNLSAVLTQELKLKISNNIHFNSPDHGVCSSSPSFSAVRLVMQFLKENNLQQTLSALQKETGVALNTVENVEGLMSDVKNGKWDAVLSTLAHVKLPVAKLIDLYEQVVLELVELREMEVARSILKQTGAMVLLKQEQPDRWLKLDHIVSRGSFEPKEGYANGDKQKRRDELADSVAAEVMVVPPSRLLSLLGQAVKYQQLIGALPAGHQYDLFRGRAPERSEDETYPRRHDKTLTFGAQSHPEVARFSPDGTVLVTGSVDGFIEVWDPMMGRLKPLPYQDEDKFMMHEAAVLCLAFTKDGEHLVSGAQDGKIKVWQLRTGRCLRAFETAHSKGVTAVRFSRDGFKVLSASFDTTVRIHGLKSGKTLKILRGHTSYVNDAQWVAGGAQVLSAGSDGSVRLWDATTTDCLATYHPGNAAIETAIHSLFVLPRNTEQFVVCNRSNTLYVMNLQGAVVRTFSNGKDKDGDFLCASISPKGEWIYAVAEDRTMYCFSMASGKLEHLLKVSERETIGMDHHPHTNFLATYDDDGSLKLWRS